MANVKMMRPVLIRVEDISKIREEMYIGKVLEDQVYLDRLGERLIVPKKVKVEVTEIYSHLVKVREQGGSRKGAYKTITYVEMLMKRVKEAMAEGENADV